MPTGTDTRPFHPGPPATRAELEAYLRGSLARDRAHQVERQLEADPLLREAAEGLAMPGALEALPDLRRPDGGGGTGTMVLIAAAALLLAGGAWWLLQEREGTHREEPAAIHSTGPVQLERSHLTSIEPEIDGERSTVPDPLPAAQDLHDRVVALDTTIPRERGVEPLTRRTIELPLPEPTSPKPLRAVRGGRRLVFLHDLKLVDPSELYPVDPLVNAGPEGVDARFSDRQEQEAAREPVRTMRYLDFMDRALGLFSRGDARGAMQELDFLLDQYPDDVNARFYSALCAFQLGQYAEARSGFSNVSVHPVGSFAEEARWYRALSTERVSGWNAARPLYESVATGGGFYAGRARERLDAISPTP